MTTSAESAAVAAGMLVPVNSACLVTVIVTWMFSALSSLATSLAYPSTETPPERSVLMTSLESTTLSPTPSVASPEANSRPTRRAIFSLIVSKAPSTLSPVRARSRCRSGASSRPPEQRLQRAAGVGLVQRTLVSAREDAECVDGDVVHPLQVVNENGCAAASVPPPRPAITKIASAREVTRPSRLPRTC